MRRQTGLRVANLALARVGKTDPDAGREASLSADLIHRTLWLLKIRLRDAVGRVLGLNASQQLTLEFAFILGSQSLGHIPFLDTE